MALRTRERYLASLKGMRPNIHKFGELIRDITTHPATRRVVESHARAFDAAFDPKLSEIFTATSSFTREKTPGRIFGQGGIR
jgi:4-hydroxybutyryl-CoA dehydratase/vinylacetyl-CoA-Delta-isomerase